MLPVPSTSGLSLAPSPPCATSARGSWHRPAPTGPGPPTAARSSTGTRSGRRSCAGTGAGAASTPRTGEADMSHKTHTHVSWYRDSEKRDKVAVFRPYFQEEDEPVVNRSSPPSTPKVAAVPAGTVDLRPTRPAPPVRPATYSSSPGGGTCRWPARRGSGNPRPGLCRRQPQRKPTSRHTGRAQGTVALRDVTGRADCEGQGDPVSRRSPPTGPTSSVIEPEPRPRVSRAVRDHRNARAALVAGWTVSTSLAVVEQGSVLAAVVAVLIGIGWSFRQEGLTWRTTRSPSRGSTRRR